MTEREVIEEKLATVYTESGVELWMSRPHALLAGEIPSDLIERGKADLVLTVATQLAESAYA